MMAQDFLINEGLLPIPLEAQDVDRRFNIDGISRMKESTVAVVGMIGRSQSSEDTTIFADVLKQVLSLSFSGVGLADGKHAFKW
jgi:hypothetical protein